MLPTGGLLLGYFLAGVLINVGKGHVSLTFPPARQLPLDFLNTFWTKQPCGMPKGGGIKTTLVAGQTFNLTWHLGYAHQGGYRLELLDSKDNRLMDLTPTRDNEFHGNRITAQSHLVELPENASCPGCTIRLLRQVPEFAPNFQFISCADVDIVGRGEFTETCSGHGYSIGGKCTCYARYWGDRCQYLDECDKDVDCSDHGRCINLGGSALPRKQCFCEETHFGHNCNRQNPARMPNSRSLDLSKHIKVPLSDRFNLFFRMLLGSNQFEDEIEFVLRINGTSYGGLGWRPNALGPVCKSWPFYPDALFTDEETSSSPSHRIAKRDSTFTITKSIDQTPNSDQYYSPPTGRKATSDKQSISSSSFEPSPTYLETVSTVSHSSSSSTSSSGSRNQRPLPHDGTTSYSQLSSSQDIPKTTETSSLGQEIRSSTSNSPPASADSEPGSAPGQHQFEKPSFTPSEWAAQDPFTPMDCTDIVMGAARGPFHRIRDTYARGRHTPLPDHIWGGRDDLTAASGWETDGMTTLIFRRRLISSDGPDHTLKGDMLVIWARGQQPGEEVTSPHHQLEQGNPITSNFYTEDEYKYHGLGPQRGLIYIDFTAVRKEFSSGGPYS